MAAELYVGNTEVQHARQPEGSEQCYAAMVRAVSGAPVHIAQAALYRAGMVEDDGSVGLVIAKTQLEMPEASSEVEIDPQDQIEDPEEVLKLMDEIFKGGRSVTFLHRKPLSEEELPDDHKEEPEVKYHWVLLNGYPLIGGEPGPIHTINPLHEEAGYTSRPKILEIIRRSNDYENGGMGVFVQAISNGSGSRA